MKIRSAGTYRAKGKTYEKLIIKGTGSEDIVKPYIDSEVEAMLPCRLYHIGEDEYFAITPNRHGIKANYNLGVFNQDGICIDSTTRTVVIEDEKSNPIAYKLHSGARDELREFSKTAQDEGPLGEIKILGLTPGPACIQCRVSVCVQNATSENLRFKVLGHNFQTMAQDCIFMGENKLEFSDYSTDNATQVNLSVAIPYGEKNIYFVAWDKNHPENTVHKRLSKSRIEELVGNARTNLYRNVGNDPFYDQWFNERRINTRELWRQRTITFPSMPKFSIVARLQGDHLEFLECLISSLSAQTYANWECVFVYPPTGSRALRKLIAKAAKADSRFKSTNVAKSSKTILPENFRAGEIDGDFVCFLEHNSVLEPNALFEYAKVLHEQPDIDLIYCDEDQLDENNRHCNPIFKCDFNLDLVRSYNYLNHMLCARRTLLEQLGLNAIDIDDSQMHDVVLRLIESTRRIHHVPHVLHHQKKLPSLTGDGAEMDAIKADASAVQRHLDRTGTKAQVTKETSHKCKIQYAIPEHGPLVSIVIPNKDHIDLLKPCIDSILNMSTYDNYEITIVENNSTQQQTFDYYAEIEEDPRIHVTHRSGTCFNFSEIVNHGANHAHGEYLLFLNNDTVVITGNWIEKMLGNCMRNEIGAVGCKLYYPDDTIQHAGCLVCEVPCHTFLYLPREGSSYMDLSNTQRNTSAVTGACLMVSAADYESVNGFDPTLPTDYNDIDFCLKLVEAGKLNVYLPDVELYHFESISRGKDSRIARFNSLCQFQYRWKTFLGKGDPCYNANLQKAPGKAMYWAF